MAQKNLNVLYVSRKYPPSTGGMESAAYELHQELTKIADVQLVKWGGRNKALPIVYPWLLLRALWSGIRERPDVIYLQDGLMAPLGWVLQLLLRRPTVMTVHGLEATYKNWLYQHAVTPFISKQDQIVVGSTATKQVVEQAFPGVKPKVIYYGVRDTFYSPLPRDEQLQLIATATDIPLELLRTSTLLFTSGRLVERKGVLWFVNNVMPDLVQHPQNVLYLVAGTGNQYDATLAAINERKLKDSVYLLGRVPDELLRALYNAADIFVMPNIPVDNDMEGFGLVSTEAASCGTLVICSKLEGIQDAIIAGQNGLLVEPGDARAYLQTIRRELAQPSLSAELIRHYTLEHYSWKAAGRQYEAAMRALSPGSSE